MRADLVGAPHDRLDVLDLGRLEEDVADRDEQRALVDRLDDRLVVLADDDLETRLRLVEVANGREVAAFVDDPVPRGVDREEAREHDGLGDRHVLVHHGRARRGADDPPDLVAHRHRRRPPALPPGADTALAPLARVVGETLLRLPRHRGERVVDEVGGVLQDGELGAVVEEIAHDGQRRPAMRAMVLRRAGHPLEEAELPDPKPATGQALLRVLACGVCRTDLHVLDGELTRPKLPLVLGHEIVGEVVSSAGRFAPGDRVGVPWLGWTCGDVRALPRGPREPVRPGTVHGVRPRRRLRRALRRRRALLLPRPRRLRRSPGCAAPLRRADRLPVAPARGRRGEDRALRVRRGRAHRLPGRPAPGTRGVRPHAAR